MSGSFSNVDDDDDDDDDDENVDEPLVMSGKCQEFWMEC